MISHDTYHTHHTCCNCHIYTSSFPIRFSHHKLSAVSWWGRACSPNGLHGLRRGGRGVLVSSDMLVDAGWSESPRKKVVSWVIGVIIKQTFLIPPFMDRSWNPPHFLDYERWIGESLWTNQYSGMRKGLLEHCSCELAKPLEKPGETSGKQYGDGHNLWKRHSKFGFLAWLAVDFRALHCIDAEHLVSLHFCFVLSCCRT